MNKIDQGEPPKVFGIPISLLIFALLVCYPIYAFKWPITFFIKNYPYELPHYFYTFEWLKPTILSVLSILAGLLLLIIKRKWSLYLSMVLILAVGLGQEIIPVIIKFNLGLFILRPSLIFKILGIVLDPFSNIYPFAISLLFILQLYGSEEIYK